MKKVLLGFILCASSIFAYEENIFDVQTLQSKQLYISLYQSQKSNTSYGFIEDKNSSYSFLGSVKNAKYFIEASDFGNCTIENTSKENFQALCKINEKNESFVFKKGGIKAKIYQLTLKDKIVSKENKDIDFEFVDSLIFIDSKNQKLQKIVDDFNENLDKKSLKEKLAQANEKWISEAISSNENLNQSYIFYYDGKIISLGKDIYEYKGGAHGITTIQRKTYDIDSMKLIQLKNELKIENDEFINLIKSKLLNEHDKNEFFNMDEFKMSEIFEVRQNGLIFVWEPYEIAPYSSGTIELFISYEELKPFWRANSKLAYLSL
ncbi:DUF3298 and DUF4163 domain-containing protein [Campylobacter volucris]|uniref:DUF3298 and DUF4163 domain-containing protein n=1 Tax=Campylobacter volucris TaxID=1031542 RepID=A0A5C7E168_9BACT|nr:DUF3298 and DUF4163 domain-containing protein [Campylobacter volucris]TXE86358.1 DUF3298 and DUF4163 domain-containing protein [Campylobacter volucris]